jgi:dTDP-4-amino-4,6-dideoxygalactose transaminase
MKVEFSGLAAQQARILPGLNSRIQRVLAHGSYIMGPEVGELERALADFSGVSFALGCGNGTDALQLALMALGVGAGDAVFCPSFTFAASAEVIPATGATPVFVDVQETTYTMDLESLKRALRYACTIGLRPAAVIPVDLFGLPADYDPIEEIARENDMWIIADAAQAFGATYKGKRTGSLGDIAVTSFFPAKPLGCYGDGGAVFTSDEALRDLIESLRVHGKGDHKYENVRIGVNSRLDTLQAAILLEKLQIYDEELQARQLVAGRYSDRLGRGLGVPSIPAHCSSVWAQYTVRAPNEAARTEIMSALAVREIPSAVYYPRPLHRQPAYKSYPADPAGLPVSEKLARQVFSVPMHPYLCERDQDLIIEVINDSVSGR